MDVVAASGELRAELVSDAAGAAVGWIASYADSHDRFRQPTRFDYVTGTVRTPCGTKHPMLESRPIRLSEQKRSGSIRRGRWGKRDKAGGDKAGGIDCVDYRRWYRNGTGHRAGVCPGRREGGGGGAALGEAPRGGARDQRVRRRGDGRGMRCHARGGCGAGRETDGGKIRAAEYSGQQRGRAAPFDRGRD